MTAAKVWFLLMLASTGLSFYFYHHPLDLSALKASAAPQPVLQPVRPQVQPEPVAVPSAPLPPVKPNVSEINLQDFLTIKSGLTDGEWEFQLDARQLWKPLPDIFITDGDEVEFSASGWVCGNAVGCVGPNGQHGPAGKSLTRPEEFAVDNAWCQALVARVGSDKFQVGDHKTFVVPVGTGQQPIEVMDNFRIPELGYATGGFRVKVSLKRH
jgi:hypothetical protein